MGVGDRGGWRGSPEIVEDAAALYSNIYIYILYSYIKLSRCGACALERSGSPLTRHYRHEKSGNG